MDLSVEAYRALEVEETSVKRTSDKKDGNYTVKSGDTVYKLSRMFNFKSEQEFRNYVKISGTAQLYKNSKINLPTAKLETTVSAIAKKYNMTSAELLKLNPQIKDPARLPKGTVLYVPRRPFGKTDKGTTAAATNVPTKKAVAKKTATNVRNKKKVINVKAQVSGSNSKKYKVVRRKTSSASAAVGPYNRKYVSVRAKTSHKVASGENLSVIAKKYGLSVSELKAANGLKSNSLQVGDELNIPAGFSVRNVSNLADVSEATGLSLQYIKNLKKKEDSAGFGPNDFHQRAFKDPNGNWTIGVGHLIRDDERGKYLNTTLSKKEVCTLLAKDIIKKTDSIRRMIGDAAFNKMPTAMKDAVCDYVFSRGEGSVMKQPGFIDALKRGNYAKAISLMNVAYSVVRGKNGKLQKKYMVGIAKRRLFEIHLASRMYGGKLPANVKKTVQVLYDLGLRAMRTEYPDADKRADIKAGFDAEVKAWFGGNVNLR